MFNLAIETTNAAFDVDPGQEIARILFETRVRIEAGNMSGSITDYNGNTVGTFEYKQDEDGYEVRDDG